MAINIVEAGKYIGYTKSGSKPTLYFENGHFTQVHDYRNNTGWHPNGLNYHYGNIGVDGQSRYSEIINMRDKKSQNNEFLGFLNKFKAGDFNSNASNAKLFESFGQGEYASKRMSRSLLVERDQADHNKEYDNAYIKDVLSKGSWALKDYC